MRSLRPLFAATSIALLCAAPLHAVTFPGVTSATKSLHFDASDLNNDGGASNPASGTDISNWSDLVSGATVNANFPTDGRPTFISAGVGGQPTVRFDATAAGGDLLFNNGFNFNAQTIYVVATMADNGTALSTMFANATANLNVRQSTSSVPAYFTGNAADFINGNNGTFGINGNKQFAIPGGYDAGHAIKAVRDVAANYVGFRFSDNIAANRRWNGDISEVIMFDGKLSGDDALVVQKYITQKYGIPFNAQFDERITQSKQIALAPFEGLAGKQIGVNFHYGTAGLVADTFQGIGFDNIDLTGGTPPTGPFNLTANPASSGATLTLNFPFTEDNTVRTQSAGITGDDAATLNAVANHMFYVSGAGRGHDSATMTFAGLDANREVFVQVIGGDNGWAGQGQVLVNGDLVVDWLSAVDGLSNNSASLLGFFATTDSTGNLAMQFTVPVNNNSPFIGISGLIITAAPVVPEPATGVLGLIALAALSRRRQRNDA